MLLPQMAHLHVHGINSRLDGMIASQPYVDYCVTHGMKHAALTDHGNMSGSIQFYSDAKEAGINPIIGQEIYLVDDHAEREGQRYHEGLLAMDWQGYQNLVHLSSVGFTDGLRRNYFACIDDAQIAEHNLGIICLSGCISSRLARTIMGARANKISLEQQATDAIALIGDPKLFDDARRKARSIATNAVGYSGVKKTKAIAQAQEQHAFLDTIQSIAGKGSLEAYVDDLYIQANEEWARGWAAGKIIVERRLETFGDRYYLETQIIPSEDQTIYNGYVRQLSAEYGIPCVVTADAHYLTQDDADLHRQMLRIRTGKRKEETPKEKKPVAKITFADDISTAVLASTGDADELGLLYDDIIREEMACAGKQPKTHTAAYADRRKKWTTSAQLYFLQNTGGAEELAEETVEEDAVSVDAIDPGRPFAEWTTQFWVRTPQEMVDTGAIVEEMENTVKLAERVKLEIPVNDADHRIVHMPDFPLPTKDDGGTWTSEDYLGQLCLDGLRSYLDDVPALDAAKYHARLDYELRVIVEAGFSNYFLIVWDYINYIREIGGLTGPGRGSAAASLVTFLLGITKRIDPLQYSELMFERFLTPGRPDLPDIDTDIDFQSAELVYEYCKERYGADRVSQIGTFSEIGVRQALQDIGRVLQIPFQDVDRASKFFSDFRPDDDQVLEDNKAVFSLQDVANMQAELSDLRDKSDLHKQWFDYANRLQGTRRNASQHASGVAIASKPLVELGVPLMATYNKTKQKMTITTQYDMDDLATLGIPKFDQLKLSNLNIIAEAERLVGSDFSIEEIPLDDKATYAALSKGDNLGIFQVAQPKVRSDMRAIKPQTLSDIAAIITIIRPGLFARDAESGLTMQELFKARANGSKGVTYLFPFMEEITKTTQGIMIYQEQVLQVLWKSGMTPLEADQLRKILSKKQMSKAVTYEAKFVSGIQVSQGLTEDEAKQLWLLIVEFAAYGFNAAHAYAYGLIAYWTSYLKTHFPAQFMAATFSVVSQKNSKAAKLLLPKLLEDCGQMGRSIKILPPNVNKSNKGFMIESFETPNGLEEAIRFGLAGIKNVGALAEATITERCNGEYLDFEDYDKRLTERMKSRPNRNALSALAYAGAFDDMFTHRNKALWTIEMARTDVKYKRQQLFNAGWQPERKALLDQKQAELCGSYYFVRDNEEVLGREVDNFFDKSRGDFITIGGRVIEAKLDKKTKTGKHYHRVVIKTQWGDVSVDFYPGQRDDSTSYLAKLKEKLFAGSVIIVTGKIRDEASMFGKDIKLPAKQFQGEFIEDPKVLRTEALALLS